MSSCNPCCATTTVALGGGGDCGDLTKQIWVDAGAEPGGDGTFCAPFQTIQEAVDIVAAEPPATTDVTNPWTINVAAATYTEDLVVPNGKYVLLNSLGLVTVAGTVTWDVSAGIQFLQPSSILQFKNSWVVTLGTAVTATDVLPGPNAGTLIATDTNFNGGVSVAFAALGNVSLTINLREPAAGVLSPFSGNLSNPGGGTFSVQAAGWRIGAIASSAVILARDCQFTGDVATGSASLFNCRFAVPITVTVTADRVFGVDGATEYNLRFIGATFAENALLRIDDPLPSSVSITDADSPFAATQVLRVIFADSSAGAITVTLPAAPAVDDEFTVKDSGGDAGTNSITVDGDGNSIDGAATSVIGTDYGALKVKWNGDEWSVL